MSGSQMAADEKNETLQL